MGLLQSKVTEGPGEGLPAGGLGEPPLFTLVLRSGMVSLLVFNSRGHLSHSIVHGGISDRHRQRVSWTRRMLESSVLITVGVPG